VGLGMLNDRIGHPGQVSLPGPVQPVDHGVGVGVGHRTTRYATKTVCVGAVMTSSGRRGHRRTTRTEPGLACWRPVQAERGGPCSNSVACSGSPRGVGLGPRLRFPESHSRIAARLRCGFTERTAGLNARKPARFTPSAPAPDHSRAWTGNSPVQDNVQLM
jgi:hypothetical protein